MKKLYPFRLLVLWFLLLTAWPVAGQTTSKKVVLQAFWWDYYNDTYRFKWADYITELAPRLKSMGIDAVWIPPTPKNKNATNDVGYSPFDHYDLGDKYQKGDTRTRFGSKDEFLRMVAVLHANGIEVIQDVVMNHVDGAGGTNGYGGLDPDAYSTQSNGGYKSFRYASFGTPAPQVESATESQIAAEYLSRRGRWSKNYPNFHPHLGHNSTSGVFAEPMFGPDFCFGDDGGGNGYGGLSAAITSQFPNAYDPVQGPGYSRNEARNWMVWMKKQTGVDGFRWDAVKHFSYAVQQDLSFNVKYNAGWANGGETMFNVGEYVGGKAELDGYTNSVNAQNGGSDFLLGTFDFGLREGIYSMVYGNGGFDMGNLPSRQQDRRVQYYAGSNTFVHRTVPFVNNHDTFRPQLTNGNYSGWNTSQELAPHIDPFEPRLSAAYAVALAVDGSPQIFFEDLFNIGSTGKRFNHEATSTTDLPVRSDLANLIWCHQNLEFKNGAYKVRWQGQDLLVIERGARALIGINDNWNTWQDQTVQTDFAPGTRLKDYSGANGTSERTVDGTGRVYISVPPCDGTALQGRRGYSVWAPVGQDNDVYQPQRAAVTTQEWEMADDLGDLHCSSLGQGGALPDNSTNLRVVGKIYAQAGQAIGYELYPSITNNPHSITIGLYDLQGNLLGSASGTASAIGSFTSTVTGWYVLKVRNTAANTPGQRCFVKASYTAPATLNTRTAPQPRNEAAIWTGNNNSADPADCRNWENGVEPTAATNVRIPAGSTFMPALNSGVVQARNLTLEPGATLTLAAGTTLRITGNFDNRGTLLGEGTVELAGTTAQTISGNASTFVNLTLNNPADVSLLAPVTITGTLSFTSGRLALGNQNLTLGPAASITGATDTRYLVTNDLAAGAGFLIRSVPATNVSVSYPVGTASSYTPLSISNTGAAANFRVRTFTGLFQQGNTGAPYAQAQQFVNRTWEIAPSGSGVLASVTFQWNAADENASFRRMTVAGYRNNGSSWQRLNMGPVGGTGPFTFTVTDVSAAGRFAIGNAVNPLPVSLAEFTAQRQGSGVLLTWATVAEKNNAGFEVEKSADGRAFRRIGQVSGQGTTAARQQYRFLDADAAPAAYYRLRQLDTDGTATFSAPVFVPSSADRAVATLFPNPTTGDVTLTGLPAEARISATLRSAHGRTLLASETASAAETSARLSAFLRRAAPGVYLLSVEGTGPRQVLKVVKQ
ncbi:alpha-amylase domain-containing protein [Hymenobacter koreensis]|uniref:Alpha-amylase n=1 Tax=Hymenobacter koreensis TaxID=1084523 RepID=A0ABP8IZ81_9BACT